MHAAINSVKNNEQSSDFQNQLLCVPSTTWQDGWQDYVLSNKLKNCISFLSN